MSTALLDAAVLSFSEGVLLDAAAKLSFSRGVDAAVLPSFSQGGAELFATEEEAIRDVDDEVCAPAEDPDCLVESGPNDAGCPWTNSDWCTPNPWPKGAWGKPWALP